MNWKVLLFKFILYFNLFSLFSFSSSSSPSSSSLSFSFPSDSSSYLVSKKSSSSSSSFTSNSPTISPTSSPLIIDNKKTSIPSLFPTKKLPSSPTLIPSLSSSSSSSSSSSPTITSNDYGYIIIQSKDGLANRLRLLAGYLYVSKVTTNFSHIYMIWEINDACPGHFLQLFQPLNNVTFISPTDLNYLSLSAKHIYPPSYMNYLEVLQHFDLHHKNDKPILWHHSRLEMYAFYKPIVDITEMVSNFVFSHNICKCVAIHVRRTDLDEYIKTIHLNHTDDENFQKYIESQPPNRKIFLMTDNPRTQQQYLSKYGDRIIIYKKLTSNVKSVNYHRYLNHPQINTRKHLRSSLSSSSHYQSLSNTSRKLSIVRYTSLQHTLIEVLIAAHSMDYLGSNVSSLSELIHLMNLTYVSSVKDPCYNELDSL